MEYGDNYNSSTAKDVSDGVSEQPVLDLKLKGNAQRPRHDAAVSAPQEPNVKGKPGLWRRSNANLKCVEFKWYAPAEDSLTKEPIRRVPLGYNRHDTQGARHL